ncbi:ArsR/SmtB family transcription factor [Sandaracinus amylolyticus]|uniref:ArsR/SmtB family transcription factor n=1 Tax=Sandaracinus amylolyticus TaxID=927083 RepID=UPI0022A6EAE0|nr:metalloregulator ArsR/SmtB family transcription factor [Sandaracinus amylolyticus]UJR84914.1 Hypothetical protein I5071_69930 [Sandaracinus amylolyticus]
MKRPPALTERERAALALTDALDPRLLTALAEPVRLEIVKSLLLRGPADATAIAAPLPVDRSVVSRHLKILLDSGMITVRKEGRRRIYELDGPTLVARFDDIAARTRSVVALCCPSPTAALRRASD